MTFNITNTTVNGSTRTLRAQSHTLWTAKPSQTQNIEPKSTGVPHDPTVHGSSVFLLFAYRDGRVAWRGPGDLNPGSAQRARPRRTHRDKTQYTRRGWVRQPKHYHEDESGEATTSEFRNLLILRLCRPVISEPASAYSSNAPNPLPIAPRYRLAVIEGLGGRLLLTH